MNALPENAAANAARCLAAMQRISSILDEYFEESDKLPDPPAVINI